MAAMFFGFVTGVITYVMIRQGQLGAWVAIQASVLAQIIVQTIVFGG